MKKHYSLFTKGITGSLLLLLIAICSYAQPQYFSNGGTSANSFPFNSTTSNKVQWIYIPTDFPGAPSGLITKVYFRSGTAGTNKTFTNLTIKMGYTTATTTATGNYFTGLTTVLALPSVTIPSTTVNGWVQFTLATPFFYDNTKNLIVEASQTAFTSGFTVIQNTANGNKRLFGSVTATTGTAGTGLVNFGFDLLVYQNNASLAAIPEPFADFCVGTQAVKVQVKNTGANVINNVTLNWTMDGQPQPPIVYTSPIPIGVTTQPITLGSATFPGSLAQHIIKAWTSAPNGQVDPQMIDDSMTIMRKALDIPPAYVLFTKTRICPGDSLLLTAPTGSNYTYQWQLDANPIVGSINQTLYAKKDGYYSVKVFNPGCSSQSGFQKITVKELNINLGADTSLCETSPALVLDGGEPDARYLWSTGDTVQAITVTDKSGQYWVKATLGAACSSSDTINLAIEPLPRVNGISYTKSGATYHFSPSGPHNVVSYLWSFGDGGTDTAMNPVHTYSIGSPYTVDLNVYNSCGVTFAKMSLPLNVRDISLNDAFTVYPNPAQSNITITGRSAIKEVHILNGIGAEVYNQTFEGQKKAAINIQSLPNGNYSLLIHTDEGIVNKRFGIVK